MEAPFHRTLFNPALLLLKLTAFQVTILLPSVPAQKSYDEPYNATGGQTVHSKRRTQLNRAVQTLWVSEAKRCLLRKRLLIA